MIPGFRYTYILRKASHSKTYSPMWFVYKVLLRRYSFKYGIQIPASTDIGHGFYIGHFGTIVVNNKAKIGDNCNIAHNVTIGQANRGERKGYPTINNNVWIGTGSVIVGNINIGDNVLIAPNSYVNIDIPAFSIVMGNPCKIIKKDDPTLGYINHILEI
jgi:serine O-acetyltransferase